MGNPITGRQTVFALKKAATWRTAVQVGANDGILIDADSFLSGRAIEQLPDKSLPLAFVRNINVGGEKISGSIKGRMRYQGFELPTALVLGDPQAKTGADPYDKIIYPLGSIAGLFASYATKHTTTEVKEVPSVKFTGFTFSAEKNKELMVEYKMVGNLLAKTGDAGIVNTISDLAAVTYDDNVVDNVVVMDRNSDFQINTEGSVALSTSDRLGISKIDIAFDRKIDEIYTINGVDNAQDEPLENDHPEGTVKIHIPTFADSGTTVTPSAFENAWNTTTTYKAMMKFYKSANFALYFYFPRLKIVGDPFAVGSPGRIPMDITFQMLQASSNPDGMSNPGPMYVLFVNRYNGQAW